MSVRTTAARLPGGRLALLALAGLALSLAGPAATLADQGKVDLALLPLGQSGSFFDLAMVPGQARSFSVDIANNGAAPVAARTYAADVYTIINGGFGARLRGQAGSGMTDWLTYPTRVWTLAAGQVVRQSFDVRVPVDAAPGEYITSLVLENDQPVGVPGALALSQFIRQAVAVVVTVPGPRTPVLAVGAATVATDAGRSVVSVAVANAGNVRLSPVVAFALLDASGQPISQSTFQMGTFYAHTSTSIEVPLTTLLPPGTYLARVTLSDAAEDISVAGASPVVVAGGAARASPGGGQAVGQLTGTGTGTGSPAPSPAWVVLLIAAAILALALGTLLAVVSHRPRRRAGRGIG
ncbi:MAG TPA: hypothetical protein VKR24_05400 [Candidatus Limnocylindrales bacterium]|nr:hypothetical protein [Candidatus Limnocylindrales bacterium]